MQLCISRIYVYILELLEARLVQDFISLQTFAPGAQLAQGHQQAAAPETELHRTNKSRIE